MSGRNIKINQIASGMPQVDSAIDGWEISFIVKRIRQVRIDGEIKNRSTFDKISGCLQPLQPKQLMLKPEGQREWKWYQLHVKKQYASVPNGTIIKINNTEYKVMASKDYTLNGYIEYHLLQDFKQYDSTK